jgi:hypothetical protein
MSANDEEWIAGHEAAHAASAIEMQCPNRAICLKPLAGTRSLSNARTVWQPGNSPLLNAATVAASGPAYDANVVVQFGISQPELTSTAEFDRQASDNLADAILGKKNSQVFVDHVWSEATQNASAIIALAHMQHAIGILKALIRTRRAAGDVLIGSKNIYDAVRNLFPPEKLDLTDPNEAVSNECQKW